MKRINPKTGLPFCRGEKRDDEFSFVRYRTSKPIKTDGYFIEDWKSPKKQIKGIKRINSETGAPFKRGDKDPDTGKVFSAWDYSGPDKNGFVYEVWTSEETLKNKRKKHRLHSRRHKEKNKNLARNGAHQKRLNPVTGIEFKTGDTDSDGRIFLSYSRNMAREGFIGEEWGDETAFIKRQIGQARQRARVRAVEKSIPFEVSSGYLFEIYPKDEICPVFKIKMQWLGDKSDSPSLDRLKPERGYVPGNVAWICSRANTLKLDRTPEILRKIADWIDHQTNDAAEL